MCKNSRDLESKNYLMKEKSFFEKMSQVKSIEEIKKIDKFQLDFLGKNVFLKIFEGDIEVNSHIKDMFYNLNYLIDEYLEGKDSVISEFYNVFAIHYLSDVSNYILMNQKEKTELSIIYNTPPYNKIIEVLNQKNYVTHQELANILNISKSNLTNYINRIKPYDIIQVKNIIDNKKKYYYLTYKTKQYIKQGKNRRTLCKQSSWGSVYEERKINYKNYENNVKEAIMYVKRESSNVTRQIQKATRSTPRILRG